MKRRDQAGLAVAPFVRAPAAQDSPNLLPVSEARRLGLSRSTGHSHETGNAAEEKFSAGLRREGENKPGRRRAC